MQETRERPRVHLPTAILARIGSIWKQSNLGQAIESRWQDSKSRAKVHEILEILTITNHGTDFLFFNPLLDSWLSFLRFAGPARRKAAQSLPDSRYLLRLAVDNAAAGLNFMERWSV